MGRMVGKNNNNQLTCVGCRSIMLSKLRAVLSRCCKSRSPLQGYLMCKPIAWHMLPPGMGKA